MAVDPGYLDLPEHVGDLFLSKNIFLSTFLKPATILQWANEESPYAILEKRFSYSDQQC